MAKRSSGRIEPREWAGYGEGVFPRHFEEESS